MKERPILFSGEMVRAILEGRKTQTRRVVKEPICTNREIYADAGLTWYGEYGLRNPCKFGQPGDRLWVKETHSFPIKEPCNRADVKCPQVAYRADGECAYVNKWRPSIFMPRWASRITLEIVSVRVERLQDISEEDAKSEGTDKLMCQYHVIGKGVLQNSHIPQYAMIWNDINGPGSWDANPWVWVIEFKRVEVMK